MELIFLLTLGSYLGALLVAWIVWNHSFGSSSIEEVTLEELAPELFEEPEAQLEASGSPEAS